MSRVLVTGGTGFLGSWCIIQLLAAGHDVATTVRGLKREPDVRDMVQAGGEDRDSAIAFFEADLLHDDGWPEAMRGCDFVLHVASPFGGSAPASEADLISAARDGSLRVLRAARDAGVRRVVLTSSFAAVGYGHPARETPFTELDWTDVGQPDVAPYIKSKALGERAAWDFMAAEGGGMELSVINPVGIFGPVLGPDYSSSIEIILRFLDGSVPATPRTYFGLVDVRDAAALHLLAMTSPAAAGERFLAVAGEPLSMLDVAEVLRRELGAAAAKVPTRQLPDMAVRALALTSPRMRQIAPNLGKVRRSSNAKARRVLGWSPRPNEEVIVATARSLLEKGLVSAGAAS
jgi:dihydroflavonol-4-reductase